MATITFLSDYGYSDDFVGVCHGVIARIAPDAAVIDVTHRIARHDIRSGALVLHARFRTCRRASTSPSSIPASAASGARSRFAAPATAGVLVGPDNGLLTLAAERFGGAVEAIDLEHTPHRLEHVSATFHGRDVFAPVAAALASGAPFAARRRAARPARARRAGAAERHGGEDGRVIAHALVIDGYGNVLSMRRTTTLADAGLALRARPARQRNVGPYARVFGDVAARERCSSTRTPTARSRSQSTAAPPQRARPGARRRSDAGARMSLGRRDCTCAAPTRRTSAPRSWRRRARPRHARHRGHADRGPRPPGPLAGTRAPARRC